MPLCLLACTAGSERRARWARPTVLITERPPSTAQRLRGGRRGAIVCVGERARVSSVCFLFSCAIGFGGMMMSRKRAFSSNEDVDGRPNGLVTSAKKPRFALGDVVDAASTTPVDDPSANAKHAAETSTSGCGTTSTASVPNEQDRLAVHAADDRARCRLFARYMRGWRPPRDPPVRLVSYIDWWFTGDQQRLCERIAAMLERPPGNRFDPSYAPLASPRRLETTFTLMDTDCVCGRSSRDTCRHRWWANWAFSSTPRPPPNRRVTCSVNTRGACFTTRPRPTLKKTSTSRRSTYLVLSHPYVRHLQAHCL